MCHPPPGRRPWASGPAEWRKGGPGYCWVSRACRGPASSVVRDCVWWSPSRGWGMTTPQHPWAHDDSLSWFTLLCSKPRVEAPLPLGAQGRNHHSRPQKELIHPVSQAESNASETENVSAGSNARPEVLWQKYVEATQQWKLRLGSLGCPDSKASGHSSPQLCSCRTWPGLPPASF